MASAISSSSSSSSSSSAKRSICLCAPTTHPGSFRCKLHRNTSNRHCYPGRPPPSLSLSLSLPLPPQAKPRSTRADLIMQVIIRPSSRQLRRRRNFEPKPSRFCLLNGRDQEVAVVHAMKQCSGES